MKGIYSVKVVAKRVQYDFELHRKYTIIRGDSGTGKTILYELIQDFRSGIRSVSVICQAVVQTASGMGVDWERYLQTHSGEIIFIDEDSEWVQSEGFSRLANASENYYVIISREPLTTLPYSAKEICEIKSSGRFHTFAPFYESLADYGY